MHEWLLNKEKLIDQNSSNYNSQKPFRAVLHKRSIKRKNRRFRDADGEYARCVLKTKKFLLFLVL